MFKRRGYKSLIVIVVLLNIFTILAYPNEVYAINDNMHIASMAGDTKLGKSILLTEYLFTTTPKQGEIIDLDAEFSTNNSGKYEVLEYIEDDNGLDAFILKDEAENTILSIRGTEGSEFDGDVAVDAKLILNENEQYERLIEILENDKYTDDIDYVIGHSLGGSMALNTSLWLVDQGIDLDGVFVFAPAPIINDKYVNAENVEKVNDVLNLLVFDNEILYNIGNQVAGQLKAINPYDYFNHTIISIDNDVHSSFANHYVSRFIPIVKGQTEAKYKYIEIH